MNFLSPFRKASGPHVERVRHEPKRRLLKVESVYRLTPNMVRVVFTGEDLADFASLAFDDHVKLFVPSCSGSTEAREYTPRRFDRQARSLSLDFAIHDAGPATAWALAARPGDTVEIGGPKSSKVIAADEVTRWLLIGDETALPAIGRLIEELGSGTTVTCVVAVTGPDEHQDFVTDASLTALWTHRPAGDAADPTALLSVVRTLPVEPRTFIWIAGEARVARALRDHFAERGHPAGWMKAGGYWIRGRADAHERIG
jgi:NADPH-dependent ferric siderophore reductase